MNFTLDINKLFESGVRALESGIAPWIIFALVALVMSPAIIPAISKAIAEQRALSHKREMALKKVRNSVADRQRLPRRDR